jgi:serine/threonine protein kinase
VKLGPYETRRKIAEGGFGSVFEATGPGGERVAVKLLRLADTEELARFGRERRLLGTLGAEHGFVPLIDAGESVEGAWLAMPFLEGGTLRDRLEARTRLSERETFALARRLASALGAAHARGVVHRDLKPENVLYDAKGDAFIADLGLAKHFRGLGERPTAPLTQSDISFGTIGYIAPEQLEAAANATPASDVFSLGVILYECLAGEKPFDASNLLSFAGALETRPPPPPAGASASFGATVLRALARDPLVRYADGFAFARALGPERRGRAPLAAASAVLALGLVAFALSRTHTSSATPTPVASQAPQPPKRTPRRIEEAEALVASHTRPKEAVEIAQEVLARTPDDARALTARGGARLQLGEIESALADYRRATDVAPTAERWFGRGLLARSVFERTNEGAALDEALDSMTHAIELDPLRDDAWFLRGWLATMYTHAFERALADISKAYELNPCVNYLQHRGWVYLHLHRWEEARVDLDAAIARDPTVLTARRWRSELLERIGDYAGAIAEIEEICRREPPGGGQRALAEPRLPGLRARLGR